MTDAYQLITDYLHDRFDVSPAEITEHTTFDALGLDSLDLAEIAVILRKAHGLELDGVRAASTLREAACRLDEARSGGTPA